MLLREPQTSVDKIIKARFDAGPHFPDRYNDMSMIASSTLFLIGKDAFADQMAGLDRHHGER
jgi:hypothetical protein